MRIVLNVVISLALAPLAAVSRAQDRGAADMQAIVGQYLHDKEDDHGYVDSKITKSPRASAPLLLRALEDGDPLVRRRVLMALGKMRDPAFLPVFKKAAVSEPDAEARLLAIRWSAEFLEKLDVLELMRKVSETDADKDCRKEAAEALKRAMEYVEKPSDPAARVLDWGLENPDPKVRAHAIHKLREKRIPKRYKTLKKAALTDPDLNVHGLALNGLMDFDGPNVIATLRTLMDSDLHPSSRDHVLELLAERLPKGETMALLRQHLQDKDPRVQLAAARELGSRGDPAGYEIAMRNASAEQWILRSDAVEALAKIGKPEALPVLQKMIEDPKEHDSVRIPGYRAMAEIHLAQMTPDERLVFLESTTRHHLGCMRGWAIRKLGERWDDPSIAILKKLTANAPTSGARELAKDVLEERNHKPPPLEPAEE